MFTHIAIAAIALAVFNTCAMAGSVSLDDSPARIIKKLSRPSSDSNLPFPNTEISAMPSKESEKSKWTIMVFVNGKNNLEEFAFKNIYQMEKIGSDENIRVVVELGRMGNVPNDGDWKGCRRYLIQKAKDTDKISSPVVASIPNCDMGDYRHAIDFGKWAMSKYPAEHYMYILWDHGSGWTKAMGRRPPVKAISVDDETGHHINTPQMRALFSALGKIEVYASDACLMQMVEVAYEIRDKVQYIVGSEETEAGDGYTYDAFLKMAHRSDLSAKGIAIAAVRSYTAHYKSMATQSAVDPAALPGLVPKMNAFASAVMQYGDKEAVKSARTSTQHYAVQDGYRDNADLYHFVSLVAAIPNVNAKIKTTANDLMSYLSKNVVKENRVTRDLADSHGLAVYLPADKYDADYNELAFAKASNWPKFAQWLVK